MQNARGILVTKYTAPVEVQEQNGLLAIILPHEGRLWSSQPCTIRVGEGRGDQVCIVFGPDCWTCKFNGVNTRGMTFMQQSSAKNNSDVNVCP